MGRTRIGMLFQSIRYFQRSHCFRLRGGPDVPGKWSLFARKARGRSRLLTREKNQCVERRRIGRIPRKLHDALPRLRIRRRVWLRHGENKNSARKQFIRLRAWIGCCPLCVIQSKNAVLAPGSKLRGEQKVKWRRSTLL